MIQPPLYAPRKAGCENAHHGHKAVVDGLLPEHTVHEQAENRPVSVGGEGIHGRYGVLVAEIIESDNHQAHHSRHCYMDGLAGTGEHLVVVFLVCFEHIDSERRGERGKCRTRC